MLFNEQLADRAAAFIRSLKHTKGTWHGKNFDLLPWQEKIVRDIFGTVKESGYRQYNTAYVEIPKKQGKSELAAAIAVTNLMAASIGERGSELALLKAIGATDGAVSRLMLAETAVISLVGAIAGAMPILMGAAGTTNSINLQSWLFFAKCSNTHRRRCLTLSTGFPAPVPLVRGLSRPEPDSSYSM